MSSGKMKLRSSRVSEKSQSKETRESARSKSTEDVLLETRLNNLTTVAKTLASNFSGVKKSNDNLASPNIPRSELNDQFMTRDSLALETQVSTLTHEVASLKTEITEITLLLKQLVVENNQAKTRSTTKLEEDMTLCFEQDQSKKDKKLRKPSSSQKRKGKHESSDDSSLDTRSSISGGGKDSQAGMESEHESNSVDENIEEESYVNSVNNSLVTKASNSNDYGKALHAFIIQYSNGNRYKAESEPLDATQINQLKSSGTLVGMTVLYQLGRNYCIKKTSEYSDMYVNTFTTEYCGCIPERVYDAPLGNSIKVCFPITPLFLLFFLDRSTEDLNSQKRWIKAKYRTHISEKIETLQLYRAKIAKLSQRLFSNTYKFYECKKWIEIFGQLLLFHLDRWNKAMCRNDLSLLLNDFDLQWESQGFKARLEDLETYPGRKHELKSTVRMLNFFCERCRRLGSVTEYCDNSKCTSFKSQLHNNRPVKNLERSHWERNFKKWKEERKGSVPKTRKAYEDETGNLKPVGDSSDSNAMHASDPWDELMANQHLVKPIATPKDSIYTA